MRRSVMKWNIIFFLLSTISMVAEGKPADVGKTLDLMNKGLDVANKGIDVAQKYDKIVSAKLNAHYDFAAKAPPPLIGPGDIGEIAKNMKDGGSVKFEEEPGFDGTKKFEPPGLTVEVRPAVKKPEPTAAKSQPMAYPAGVGMLMMSGCFGSNYKEGDPCYRYLAPRHRCGDQIDAANFIGVGFDITESYSSESRKASVIQRVCANKGKFLGKDVPDSMNAFGIYDYSVMTRSFESVDSYRSYLAKKAGTKLSSGMFTQVSKKQSTASSVGSAGLLWDVGASYGQGSESTSKFGNKNSKALQKQEQGKSAAASRTHMAVLEADIKLYELALESTSPSDLNAAFLQDFTKLPTSYYLIGADVKLQDFVLRYGTHFVKAAKFGGKYSVFKKSRANSKMDEQTFAQTAQDEFSGMMSTLQSSYSQAQIKVNVLGSGGQHSSKSQSAKATKQENTKASKQSTNSGQQNNGQSKFIETTVEALGGNPEIASSIMDFYTPQFKSVFVKWLNSIADYPKPYDMTFGRIPELFDISADSLFKDDSAKAGCFGDVQTGKDEEGRTRKYFTRVKEVKDNNNNTIKESERVYCKYGNNKESFLKDFKSRRLALERAITIFIAEGPFATSSFDIAPGEVGCETETLRYAKGNFMPSNSWPESWDEMKAKQFNVIFQLPFSVPNLNSDDEFELKYYNGMWYTKVPGNENAYNMANMCPTPKGFKPENRVCVAGMNMVYNPHSGFLKFDTEYYANQNTYEANTTKAFGGHYIARAESVNILNKLKVHSLGEVPCNVKWSNTHRIDPNANTSCIHFSAASKGDIFLIFASIPNDFSTWFYLQLSPKGVAFYHSMVLLKKDSKRSSGTLGDDSLFETFFVCVNQGNGENVRIDYGKAPGEREVGSVHSTFMFPLTTKETVSFYTFASGEEKVTIDDVRVIKERPEVQCTGEQLVKVDGRCQLKCDAQCFTCHQANDPKKCTGKCRNVKHFYETKEFECLVECPAGTEAKQENGETICRRCRKGSFKESVGNGACTPCSPGTFADSEGMTVCTKCPVGHHQNLQGQESCPRCLEGNYQGLPGQRDCVPCAKGYSQSKPGQAACTKCSPGYYQNTGGRSTCIACDVGTFAAESGALGCKKCGIGSFQSKKGKAACSPCNKGHKCPTEGLSASIACPANTFNNEDGQTTCKQCTDGKTSNEGSMSCGNSCLKGTFLNSGEGKCEACAVGSIAPAAGMDACNRCPSGHTSNPTKTECVDVNECKIEDSCKQDPCLLVDTHFAGTDLAYSKENSQKKCSDNCDKNPQCSAWSYVVREGVHKGNCHLKGADYDNKKGRRRDVGVNAMLKSCKNKDLIPLADAVQSSTVSTSGCTGNPCTADKVIDGNMGTDFSTMGLTYSNSPSWWSARMTKVATIDKILVYAQEWPFSKGYYSKFKVETRMKDDDPWSVCKGEHSMSRPIDPYVVVCDRPTTAKYVRVSVAGSKPLYLREIQVFGKAGGDADCAGKLACKNSGICTNSVGSFSCKCTANFYGTTCQNDVNECTTKQPCKNSGRCVNNVGSYSCSCPTHYTGKDCQIANGNWGTWSVYGTCSTSGTHRRSRTCNNPAPGNGGKNCQGDSVQTKKCSVNGKWGGWTGYGSCSTSGIRTRTRKCDSPAPLNGGRSCGGDAVQRQACAVNGNWGSWSRYGACNAAGQKTRTRQCNNPAPKNGGRSCSGSGVQSSACKINGNWGSWKGWSCASTTGLRSRSRSCDNPPPKNGGATCAGSSTQKGSCDVEIKLHNAKQSSTYTWSKTNPTKAIDGNMNTNSVTTDENNDWWEAELTKPAYMSTVHLYLPQYPYNQGYYRYLRVYTWGLDGSAATLCRRAAPAAPPLDPFVVKCESVKLVKKLRVQVSSAVLYLTEVKVFGKTWKCPEYGIDFTGNDVGSLTGVATWQACAKACAGRSNCEAWSYVTNIKKCHFKNQNWYKSRRVNSAVISSLPACTDAIETRRSTPGLVCNFVLGDGAGTEVKAGNQRGQDCVKACIQRKKTDPEIDGVTVPASGGPGCWCEKLMTHIKSSSSYRTCFLRPGSRKDEGSLEPSFTIANVKKDSAKEEPAFEGKDEVIPMQEVEFEDDVLDGGNVEKEYLNLFNEK